MNCLAGIWIDDKKAVIVSLRDTTTRFSITWRKGHFEILVSGEP